MPHRPAVQLATVLAIIYRPTHTLRKSSRLHLLIPSAPASSVSHPVTINSPHTLSVVHRSLLPRAASVSHPITMNSPRAASRTSCFQSSWQACKTANGCLCCCGITTAAATEAAEAASSIHSCCSAATSAPMRLLLQAHNFTRVTLRRNPRV